ncbi:MAG: M1 family metallopeptidase [Rhodothermales bacterium]|nr:M1 family metallopeptidase [Rhodothermales bacterium]
MRPLCLLALLLLTPTGAAQPSPADPVGPEGYRPGVDVLRYRFDLALSDETDRIGGRAALDVRFTADTLTVLPLDLIAPGAPDEPGMTVTAVTEEGQPVPFRHAGDRLLIDIADGPGDGAVRAYTVAYGGVPADGLIIAENRHGDRTFFGDNWPNRARHWLPTVDHPSDKAFVEWAVTAPERYQVVANGRLVEETDLEGGLRLTRYASAAPLATKIAVIGAADFAVEHLGDVGGVPLQSWVYPEDRAPGFHDFARAERVLRLFASLLGEYPFEKLANVQSTTRYGGMENASSIFYDENSVTGERTNEGLIAHEVAHQWFGNAASEADWPHLWLSEGFATYLAHVYTEYTYGEDARATAMARDRARVAAFAAQQPTRPLVDTAYVDPTALLNPNSYQKGGWVLHMLRQRVGEEAFFEGLRTYYARYRGANATTADFQRVMEDVSGKDLDAFFAQWTRRPGLPRVRGTWRYDADRQALVVEVTQTQDGAPFTFPLEVGIETAGGTRIETREVDGQEETLTLPLDAAPEAVTLDPQTDLLFALEAFEQAE